MYAAVKCSQVSNIQLFYF